MTIDQTDPPKKPVDKRNDAERARDDLWFALDRLTDGKTDDTALMMRDARARGTEQPVMLALVGLSMTEALLGVRNAVEELTEATTEVGVQVEGLGSYGPQSHDISTLGEHLKSLADDVRSMFWHLRYR